MFAEFEDRAIYTTLTSSVLMAIADEDLEQAIVDYVIQKIESNPTQEDALNALSPGLRKFWLTWIVEAEVANGGFNQFYWNTDDRHNVAAVSAFEYFGAILRANLMRKANSIRLDEAEKLERFKHRNTLEAFSELYNETSLGPLDDQFYELEDDLSALRIKKIRQNPDAFIGN